MEMWLKESNQAKISGSGAGREKSRSPESRGKNPEKLESLY
jgi:hypothetical protein